MWEVFGDLILKNLIKNTLKDTHITTIPKKDKNGYIEYLYNNFKEVEVDIGDYL